MPTIKQLPTASSVSAADVVPVSQGGVTKSLSVGGLLSGTQAAIALVPGRLLGRASASAGGPEPVSLGTGLSLQGGVVSATGDDHARLPVAASLAAVDEVVVNGGGVARRLSAGLLRGLFSAGDGVSIGTDGTISSPLPTASSAALGGVKIGDGLAVGGDGTLTSPRSPKTSAAGVTGGQLAVSLLYEQSAWPITSEGLIWANTPYSYFGVSKDFGTGVGGTGVALGPVATMFAFANASGSSSDVVAVLGSAVARSSGSTVFGGNLIARVDAGVSSKLCALELDMVGGPAGSVLPGSIGLAINAFGAGMLGPAIQLGGGSSKFDNGFVVDAVRYSGLCAQTGASMTSLINASTGSYSDAAMVLGNQQRIRFQGSSAASASIGADGNKFLSLVPPENGYVFRDTANSANWLLLTQYAMTLNVNLSASAGLTMPSGQVLAFSGPGAGGAATIVHGSDGYLVMSYGVNGLVFKTQAGAFQGGLDNYGTLSMTGNINAGYGLMAGTTLGVRAMAAPGNPPSGQFYVFMDQADGKLKAKGPGGTVTVLAAA